MFEDTNRLILNKKKYLINILTKYDSIAVAFSGGVDSSLLLYETFMTLGKNNTLGIIGDSPIHPLREKETAIEFVKKYEIPYIICTTDEMLSHDFLSNTSKRCYFCKKNLFKKIQSIAEKKGINCIAQGANLDDENDYRPGMIAAYEDAVISPLIEANLNKNDIRSLARLEGLDIWNKASMSCLATRIPYNIPIDIKSLKRIEKCEDFLIKLGFEQCRVRDHGNIARIEVEPDNLIDIVEKKVRGDIINYLKKFGFNYVTVDISGYNSGSMNCELSPSAILTQSNPDILL